MLIEIKNMLNDSAASAAGIPVSNAYWISPRGVIYPVGDNHISSVISSPETFGLTREQIDAAYAEEGERIGLEGKAREKIILDLVDKGWVRIRNYLRTGWVVNLNKMTRRAKDYLWHWASEMISSNQPKLSSVTIELPTGSESMSLEDISKDKLYSESRDRREFLTVGAFGEKKPEAYSRSGFGIFEASFSRLYKVHSTGYALLSSFRNEKSKEENFSSHVSLKKDLKDSNLGYWELDGVYTYDDGTTGNEVSVLIPYYEKIGSFDEFKEMILAIAKKYSQESIVLKYPDSADDGKAISIQSATGLEEPIGKKIGFDQVGKAYSRIRKGTYKSRTFVLEGLRTPQNSVDAMLLSSQGVIF